MKEKIKELLNGYVCKDANILEDLPSLATKEGTLAFCIDAGETKINDFIDFMYEEVGEVTEEQVILQIGKVIKELITEYNLVREKETEDTMIQDAIIEYLYEKHFERKTIELGFELFSYHYIYIARIKDSDILEVDCYDDRCIPEWLEVLEELDTDDFEYIKKIYKKYKKEL